MIKYGFKIKTRGGMVVDSLIVAATDRTEAERRIFQIYHQCEILDCRELHQAVKEDGFNLESAITLIGKEPDLDAPPDKSS
jgi:hypothetical protein